MTDMLLRQLARPDILAMQGYSSARMEAGDAPVILNANENPWPPDCDHAPEWQINRYPAPQPSEVVNRLAEIYAVKPQQILVTRGSDEGIDLLVRAFCRAGQDAIAFCPPAFGMYSVAAAIQGAAIHTVNLMPEDHWQLDIDAIAKTQAKLVFLCRPNNPTGHVLTIDEVMALCQQLDNKALIIVDEAYIEFSTEKSVTTELGNAPNLVVLRTLSKAWGMAGLRCGAVLADTAIIHLLRKIMAPYPLPIASQRLVTQALTKASQLAMKKRIALLLDERQRVAAALSNNHAVHTLWPSQANFLLLKVNDANHMVCAAAEAGILIRNQSAQPNLENCVRISIGAPDENTMLLRFMQSYEESV